MKMSALRSIRALFKGFGNPRELGRLARRFWGNPELKDKPTVVAAMRSIMLQRTEALRTKLAESTAEVLRETVTQARQSTRMVLVQQKTSAELRRVQGHLTPVKKQIEFLAPRLHEDLANDLIDSVSKSLERSFEGYAGDLANTIVDAANPNIPLTMSQLSSKLENDFLQISKKRANMIARTESARVYGEVSLNEMRKLGIEDRRWLTAAGSPAASISPVCPFCIALANQGWTSVNESITASLSIGIRNPTDVDIESSYPPYHPNCRCDIQANVDDWEPDAENFGDVVDCTSPCDVEEEQLLNGEFSEVESFEGGVNDIWIGRVGNRTAVWKKEGIGHQLIKSGGEGIRERAATLVNKGLGNLIRMPKVVLREAEKFGGKIVIQTHVPNKGTLVGNAGKGTIERKQLVKYVDDIHDLGLFDAVIGNLDRHSGNFLITDSGLFGIDHGLAFPNMTNKTRKVQWFKSNAWGINAGKELPKRSIQALEKLFDSRAVLEPQLIELLGKRANDLMWQRSKWLLEMGRSPTVAEFENFLLGKFHRLPKAVPKPIPVPAIASKRLGLVPDVSALETKFGLEMDVGGFKRAYSRSSSTGRAFRTLWKDPSMIRLVEGNVNFRDAARLIDFFGKNAKRITTELYRGMKIDKVGFDKLIGEWRVGSVQKLKVPRSFSRSFSEASKFTGGASDHAVVLRIKPGRNAFGIDMSGSSAFASEKEFLVWGDFKIEEVIVHGGSKGEAKWVEIVATWI